MLKNKQRSIYRRDEKDFSISSTIKKCAILCIAFFVFAIDIYSPMG